MVLPALSMHVNYGLEKKMKDLVHFVRWLLPSPIFQVKVLEINRRGVFIK